MTATAHIDVSPACAAALFSLKIEGVRFWKIKDLSRPVITHGDTLEESRAAMYVALMEKYVGSDWDLTPTEYKPETVGVIPCEWCKRHRRYSH